VRFPSEIIRFGGGQGKLVAQTLRTAVVHSPERTLRNDCSRRHRRHEHQKVVARSSRPSFSSAAFAFPKQFSVAMAGVLPFPVVFCGVITEQPDIQKVGCTRLKIRKAQGIPLVQWRSIRPNPADPMFFQKMNELRPMPAGMPKFDGKTKIPRQLLETKSEAALFSHLLGENDGGNWTRMMCNLGASGSTGAQKTRSTLLKQSPQFALVRDLGVAVCMKNESAKE